MAAMVKLHNNNNTQYSLHNIVLCAGEYVQLDYVQYAIMDLELSQSDCANPNMPYFTLAPLLPYQTTHLLISWWWARVQGRYVHSTQSVYDGDHDSVVKIFALCAVRFDDITYIPGSVMNVIG